MSSDLNEMPNAEAIPKSGTAGITIDGRYSPPPQDGDGKQWVRTSALIRVAAQDLYAAWRDVESAPKWQEELWQVVSTGPGKSHWTMKPGDGSTTIEWDAEVLADEPGKRIAWRSTGGDVEQAGEVVFDITPDGDGTIVTVLQEFKIGKVASALKTFIGRNPKQAVIENLRHFKAYMETGEIPRVQGQPHGPRGFIGEQKQALYGETTATPPAKQPASS